MSSIDQGDHEIGPDKKQRNSLNWLCFRVAVGCRDNVEPVDEGAAAQIVGLVIDFVSNQNDERKFSGLCDFAPDDVLVRVTRATFTYSCLFILSFYLIWREGANCTNHAWRFFA